MVKETFEELKRIKDTWSVGYVELFFFFNLCEY